jgi:Helix-turn-helix domain
VNPAPDAVSPNNVQVHPSEAGSSAMSSEPEGSVDEVTGQALVARELRRHRERAGLSRNQLATRVGYSRTYISTCEKPGATLVSEAVVKRIDETLNAGGDLIALHARVYAERQNRQGTDSGAVKHCLPAPSAGGLVEGSMALLEGVVGSDLDSMTMNELEDRVAILATRYFVTEPAAFQATVHQLRERIRALIAGRSTLRQRQRLFVALGSLTGMLAESAFATGEPADVHCAAAIALANEAGHDDLVAWVRGTQAQIALHTGNPQGAVRYAQAGRAGPRGSTARVRSLTYAARASARAGDRRAAFDAWQAAEQAWDMLDGSLTSSVFSLTPNYLPYCELTMLTWLGEAVPARRLAESLRSDGEQIVGRAITQIDLGLVHVLHGELDEALRAGDQAMEIGKRRLTTPLRDRFSELATRVSVLNAAAAADLQRRWVWIST